MDPVAIATAAGMGVEAARKALEYVDDVVGGATGQLGEALAERVRMWRWKNVIRMGGRARG